MPEDRLRCLLILFMLSYTLLKHHTHKFERMGHQIKTALGGGDVF